MAKIKVISIKNQENFIKLKIKNSEEFKNPILYVKARKDESCSLRILPQNGVNNSTLDFLIQADEVSPLNLYYDIKLEFTNKDGALKKKKIKSKNSRQRRMVNLLNSKRHFVDHSGKKYLITEYFASGGSFAFQVRETNEYDKSKYRWKEFLACLLAPFVYWYYKDSKLIYEKFSNYARDNSFYYFSYVQNNFKKNKLYYVINKDSPDIKNLQPYHDHIVYFMSVKHLLMIIVSKYFIASEAKGHAYAWRHNQSVARYFLNRKPFVFLQHGVLGLKQVDKTFFASNKLNHADLFITSSQIEKQIVMDYLGYDSDNVAVTGLARWDNPKKEKKEKKIFVMPTWRVQLELLSDEEFLKSDFYQGYSKLLHSEKIKSILHENGYELHFMMHPKFVKFEKYFQSTDDSIKVLHQSEVPIDKELKSSQLVITDYSSIMWDALYYGIPVLLFQFDQEEYLELQGSYLDFDSDLSGIILKDPNVLLERLAGYMRNEETVELTKYQKKYFAYRDKHNSQRIYEAATSWEERFEFRSLYRKAGNRLLSLIGLHID